MLQYAGQLTARSQFQNVMRSGHNLLSKTPRYACRPGASLGVSYSHSTGPANDGGSPGEQRTPKVIFSGIQPTGIPHLGNYLGALQQWVKLQDEAEPSTKVLFSVVDLHAITMPQDAALLVESRRNTFATLLAIGLDPKRSTIFYQSDVPQHSELMWILSCHASTGYLSRMTQWKSKLSLSEDADALDEESREKLKLGLFSYPVLQAADILVHRATHVPVGEDQSQHLEFARTVARGFNAKQGQEVLVPPSTLISPAKRVMSLTKPYDKMSKSDVNPASRIELTDTDDMIKRKIQRAVTDSTNSVSYDPENRPGVSNLIEILFHLDPAGTTSPAEMAKGLQVHSLKTFKDHVTASIINTVGPIRERHQELSTKSGQDIIREYARNGAINAQKSADATMASVRQALGLTS